MAARTDLPVAMRRTLLQLWWLPLVGAGAALALVPWHATLDSGSYLRNARVLFDGQAAAAEYLLIREPGLSLLVRALWEAFGPSELPYLAAGGALAGAAVAMAVATFPELGGRAQRAAAALVALLAPVYLVYAGLVLQQIGMAALLSAVGLVVRWATASGPGDLRPHLALAALLSLAAYWAALFLYVAVAVALALGAWRWARGRRPAVLASAAAVAVLPWVAMQPWAAWKAEVAEQRTDAYTSQVALEGQVLGRLREGLSEDPVRFVQTRALSVLALLQLERPLRQAGVDLPALEGFASSEDLQWVGWMSEPGARCGLVGLLPEGREAVLEWVDLHCRHWSPMQAYARLGEPSYLLGAAASAALVGFTALAAVRRRDWLVVLVVPWTWLALYALAGAAIDRYASPVWPLKTSLLVVLALSGTTRLLRLVTRRRSGTIAA